MKKLKIVLTCVMLLCASAVPVNVFAESTAGDDSGALNGTGEATAYECVGDPGFGISHIPLEEQLDDLINDPALSDEDKEAVKEKIQEAMYFRDEGLSSGKTKNIASATYPTTTIAVPSYTQNNEYYCGPATTMQTLKYLSYVVPGGTSVPSQEDIASHIGTTKENGTEWTRIVKYIKSFTFMGKKTSYIEYIPSSSSNMTSVIYSAITRKSPAPPILQVKVTSANKSILGYTTGGHYLNASGVRTVAGKNEIQLTDPYRGRKGLTPKYYISADDAYKITKAHWAGHFLY